MQLTRNLARRHADRFVGVRVVDRNCRGGEGHSVYKLGRTCEREIDSSPLRDWFAHCQKMTDLRDGFGISMPATMTRLVGTKAERRNGSGTGSPVSVGEHFLACQWLRDVRRRKPVSFWPQRCAGSPGCMDESTTTGRVSAVSHDNSKIQSERKGGLALLGLPYAVLVLMTPRFPSLSNSLLVLFQEFLGALQVVRRGEEGERRGDRGEMPPATDCYRRVSFSFVVGCERVMVYAQ